MPESKRTMLSVLAVPDTSSIRTAEFRGQEHTVIPTIALVEGVLWPANAPSPELALAEEFGRFPEGWNGRPVMFDHPRIDGEAVSASTPEVLEDNSFGQLFNTVLEGSKLKTEIWINKDQVENLDDDAKQVVRDLMDGKVVEVSTGLFTMNEPQDGDFDGEHFEAIWRNIVPDHLAVLPPGVQGACSVEDGCGAPRSNVTNMVIVGDTPIDSDTITSVSDNISWINSDGTTFSPVMRAARMNADCDCQTVTGNDEQEGIFKRILAMAGGVLGFTSSDEHLSDSDMRAAINAALDTVENDFFFILAVFPDTGQVVFERGFSGSLFRRDFSIDSDGTVNLSSDALPVRPVTQFVPVEIDAGEPTDNSESTIQENAMNKEELVSALIANAASQFTDDDREWLMSLEEPQLSRMAPVTAEEVFPEVQPPTKEAVTEPVVETPVVEVTEPPISTEDYIADAPEEVQAVLNEGLKMHRARKDQIVGALVANSRCKFSQEDLNAKSLTELENIASLAIDITFVGSAPVLSIQSEDDAIPEPPQLFDLSKTADAA